MTSFLITGGGGLVGSEFGHLATDRKWEAKITALSHEQCDILNQDQIRSCLAQFKPDVLINCAAYREVDKAETERDQASRLNVEGPRLLARACRQAGVKLVHFGSHGIFDGEKNGPYLESDPAKPLHHYGRTKREGEQAVEAELPPNQRLILRIAWPYGRQNNNFIGAILKKARSSPNVSVVSDQVAVASPARLIALKTLEIAAEAEGLLHLSCTGQCSRYELMALVFDRLGLNCKIIPALARDFPALAPRPKNMAIATERTDWAGRLAMPDWKEALLDFTDREGFEGMERGRL